MLNPFLANKCRLVSNIVIVLVYCAGMFNTQQGTLTVHTVWLIYGNTDGSL